MVPSPADHDAASLQLFESFSGSRAWPFVVPNEEGIGSKGCTKLFFFPVNNLVSGEPGNALISPLRATLEMRLRALPSVNELVPVGWVMLFDQMKSHEGKAYFTLEELRDIASGFNVFDEDLYAFLRYMTRVSVTTLQPHHNINHE
jgi:hypothetical protein